MPSKPQPLSEFPETMTVELMTRRIAEGDDEAFAWLYDQYCDRLFRYLVVITRGDEPLARDILQTTMTKVARALKPFSSESHLWNWLALIARNSHLDHVRKQSRSPQFVPLLVEEGPEIPIAEPLDQDSTLLHALETCLPSLPDDDRRLLEAAYSEGLTHQALAAKHDVSAKAIESKLARVRRRLREAILKHLHHEHS
jgi:RNA polymerase sigma-70 factor (ECF subfamily)